MNALSPALFDTLELPGSLQFFGDASRIEPRPLGESVNLELQHAGATALRLYLGGDPEDWGVSDWPFWGSVQRWSASGGKVEVFVPTGLIERLPWDKARAAKNSLLGLPAEIRELSGPARVGDGWLICEVVRAGHVARWAATTPHLHAPGLYWGLPDDDERIVRADAAQDSIVHGNLRGEELWERSIPGAFREVKLDLDGPASTIGERFWSLVSQRHSKLKAHLESGRALRTMLYSDRYIVSPLTAKVLSAVVSHLKTGGAIQPETRVEIRTAAGQSDRYPARLFDTWQNDATQKAVLQSLLETASGSSVTVSVQSKRDVDHQREMRLDFSDGLTVCIRLDHGLSFMECPGSCRFDFNAAPQAQARAIYATDVMLRARNDQRPIAYVGA